MSFPTLAHRRFLRNDFSTLHEEVNKLFESAFAPVRRAAVLATEYVPASDIVRDGAAVTVRVDLPGVRKEDLEITVVNNLLTVRGEKAAEPAPGQGEPTVHRTERFHGKFERTFELPNPVDAEAVKATFADGVLTVTAPIREDAKPRTIVVEGR